MANSKKSSQPKRSNHKPVGAVAAAQPLAPHDERDQYDPGQAKAYFASYRARIEPIQEAQFAFVRLDAEAAAFAGLRVDKLIKTTSLLARFKKQHEAGEFDIAHVNDLKALCSVVIYLSAEAKAAGALKSSAKIPAAVMSDALDVERRMQGVCEYHFRNDENIWPEVLRLAPGTSYRDTAGDLMGYARIYELRHAVVAADPTNYRATDVADARRLAKEMMDHLTSELTPEGRAAYLRLVRAWTLLTQVYEEVQAVGLHLQRKVPERFAQFPSLYAAGRPNSGRRKKGAAAPGESGGVAGDGGDVGTQGRSRGGPGGEGSGDWFFSPRSAEAGSEVGAFSRRRSGEAVGDWFEVAGTAGGGGDE
jgi:hypothetical protein